MERVWWRQGRRPELAAHVTGDRGPPFTALSLCGFIYVTDAFVRAADTERRCGRCRTMLSARQSAQPAPPPPEGL